LYLRNYYGNEPLFENSKIITSVYNQGFTGTLNEKVLDKVLYDGMEEENLEELKTPNYINLMKLAVKNSDAVIMGSEEVSEEINSFIKSRNIPVLPFQKPEDLERSYLDFYENKVLESTTE
jgi:starch synthase